MSLPKNAILCTVGAIIGGCLALTTTPLPESKSDCSVYKVSNKAVTSYVLKPPPAEPQKCPVAQVTKCPESVIREEPSKAEETKTEEPRHNRRRHHRIRRYWR